MENSEHRAIAVQTFNRCWDLLEGDRSAEADRELVMCAFTSRYHWLQVGGPRQFAISDWMVSRAYATTGQGALSIAWAELAQAQTADSEPAWMRASMFEGLARAHKAAGNTAELDRYRELAINTLAEETNEQDAVHIRTQIGEL